MYNFLYLRRSWRAMKMLRRWETLKAWLISNERWEENILNFDGYSSSKRENRNYAHHAS